ncbi:MAG: type II CRISPR RNA-guided endonuclease Cas9 [Caulobacterales bacterium]|nr:type II CRISPR RNA-guided endonuclease Cas9 [Caulobacterales bacterium]
MDIKENLVLGLDLGIASCGWAVIDVSACAIIAMGSRTWDAPETDKERTPTNQIRRTHRGMRRVLKRRRQRMNAVRRLFAQHGLIDSRAATSLRIGQLDPWELRSAGLDRRLTGPELAIALGHIAKHRGFKSNSKRERGANAEGDAGKMLSAIKETASKLQNHGVVGEIPEVRYRTVGELFFKDADFGARKRNRDGEFTRSVLRDDQAYEVAALFKAQRAAGNAQASAELEASFTEIAFFQRPLQDSDALVGDCPFEPGEKRAARHAPSFERFRMLSRLAAIRVTEGREERPLTADQIARVDGTFGDQKGIKWARLRKLIGLKEETAFVGVSGEDEKKLDFVGRASNAAEGTAALRGVITDALGEVTWLSLLKAPERLDAAAAIVTFREDLDSIGKGLVETGLDSAVVAALMAAVEDGRPFARFKGAAHISAKAARAMVPHLLDGKVYSEAAAAAGYDHARRPDIDIETITNPIARKAVREALKQVKAIVMEYGLPGAIHVELARDVGKSKEERDEIRSGIEKRNRMKDRLKEEFARVVGRASSGREDLLRFELWQEQKGRCLYSDREIHPDMIVAGDNTVQVDHILPWSRSGDDSFTNKTLCFAKANQDKRGRTPFEWLGDNPARWEAFRAAVESNTTMKGFKKRNYLLRDSDRLTEKFRPRNLNDTKYATRLTLDLLARAHYPESDRFTGVPRSADEARRTRRLFARPGALTDRLRRAWGLQGLKKDDKGNRIADDRHHALDALIVAAMSESTLQQLTRAAQIEEERGSSRFIATFPQPWPGFREQAEAAREKVLVSRSERRRARGEGHAQTIRRVEDTIDGPVVYERKSIDALKPADLERVKDPERNAALIASLKAWIDAGKPKDHRPLSPKGDPISKVRLATTKKVDVLIRDGVAERGEMVRVDVFRKPNKRGIFEYFLVPIYPHQVFDPQAWPAPPNRAIQGGKDEAEWPDVSDHEFLWSIYPMSFLEIEKSDGTFIDGYFRGADRSTGAIHLSVHNSREQVIRGIGVKTLRVFAKKSIDRLGRRTDIASETRTWRGAACT